METGRLNAGSTCDPPVDPGSCVSILLSLGVQILSRATARTRNGMHPGVALMSAAEALRPCQVPPARPALRSSNPINSPMTCIR